MRCKSTALNGGSWWFARDRPGLRVHQPSTAGDLIRAGWRPARVPGTVQSNLERDLQLVPLSWGPGDPALRLAAGSDWWFRTHFATPGSLSSNRVFLIFEGIDYAARIWLNGRCVAEHEGQFRRLCLEVGEHLKPSGEFNLLAVQLAGIPPEIEGILERSDGDLSGWTGVDDPENDFFVNGIIRTRRLLKGLKSPTNFGWDWGVNVWTLGIWKDVRLEVTGPARIEWIRVRSLLEQDFSRARLLVDFEVDSRLEIQAACQATVEGPGGRQFSSQLRLHPGRGRHRLELVVEEPRLWWPNGQGEPHLYGLDLVLSQGPALLDQKTIRFGIREIRWLPTEGAAEDFINPFLLSVNGRRVRQMGSNLIPPDLLWERIEERGERLLRLAQQAGMNTLRLWGGGVILPERLYDLADQLGLMLYLEFPLANSWPETDAEFLSNLEATARGIVVELRNHPSIIEWSGGNEMPWQQGTVHPALQLLERVCREEDDRIFRATSPIQGSTHSPWTYQPDSHYLHYNSTESMRYDEFGCQTPAHLETLERDIPCRQRWPLGNPEDRVQSRKNIVQAVFAEDLWLARATIESLFGPLPDLPALVEAGQFLAAEGLRYAVDELRRKGWKTAGFTSWVFNEPWPNGAGTFLVDFDGRPLMNYDFLRQALAPESISLRYDSLIRPAEAGFSAGIWVCSDAAQARRQLAWSARIWNLQGGLVASQRGTCSTVPGISEQVGVLQGDFGSPREPLICHLQLQDEKGLILTERVHVFGGPAVGIWPLRSLLVADEGIPPPPEPAQRPLRILWLGNLRDGFSPTLNWFVRTHGIEIREVDPAGSDLLGEDFSSHRLIRDYHAIWIKDAGAGGAGLPQPFLKAVAEAVEQGIGLGLDSEVSLSNHLRSTPLEPLLPFERAIDLAGLADLYPGRPHASQADLPQPPKLYRKGLLLPRPGSVVVFADESGGGLGVAADRGNRVLALSFPLDGAPSARLRATGSLAPLAAGILGWLGGRTTPVRIQSAGSLARTRLCCVREEYRLEAAIEVAEFEFENRGDSPALFLDLKPALEYRTDLVVESNRVSIPPGERRRLRVSAPLRRGSLPLPCLGWDLHCWNADPLRIDPGSQVILWVGRRDGTNRNFLAASPRPTSAGYHTLRVAGREGAARQVPGLLWGSGQEGLPESGLELVFELPAPISEDSLLIVATADRAANSSTRIRVDANAHSAWEDLPAGLGLHWADPQRLASAAAVELEIPAGVWRKESNVLKIQVEGEGWFSWDALVLLRKGGSLVV